MQLNANKFLSTFCLEFQFWGRLLSLKTGPIPILPTGEPAELVSPGNGVMRINS